MFYFLDAMIKAAKEMGFNKIALATDPFQTNNTRRFIKKYELDIKQLPIIMDTLFQLDRTEPSIVTDTLKVENFISITERESIFKRLSGTFGKHIIWQEEDLKKKRFKKKLKR